MTTTKRKSGLGGYDALIPPGAGQATPDEPQDPAATPARRRKAAVAAKTSSPVKLSGYVAESVADSVRDAAYWARLSVGDVLTLGIALAVDQLAAEHNDGKPFPPRPTAELQRGPRPR